MPISTIRAARDYNRGLAGPVRAAHVVAAGVRAGVRVVLGPVARWAGDPVRRVWAQPVVWGGLAFLALLPFDGVVVRLAMWMNANLGGDPRRELNALQQYGQFSVSVLLAVGIWLQDPRNRARLIDWAVAWAVTAAIVFPMKVLVARPRPRFGDGVIEPWAFPGPFGAWPLGVDGEGRPRGVRHGWELWGGIRSDLWSMPSSHTAYAVVASVVLARLYPRLTPLAIGMASLVGVARVLLGAHFPSDVAVGAAAGLLAARLSLDGGLGAWVRGRVLGPARAA